MLSFSNSLPLFKPYFKILGRAFPFVPWKSVTLFFDIVSNASGLFASKSAN